MAPTELGNWKLLEVCAAPGVPPPPASVPVQLAPVGQQAILFEESLVQLELAWQHTLELPMLEQAWYPLWQLSWRFFRSRRTSKARWLSVDPAFSGEAKGNKGISFSVSDDKTDEARRAANGTNHVILILRPNRHGLSPAGVSSLLIGPSFPKYYLCRFRILRLPTQVESSTRQG